jgi:hypothetical protein
MFDLAGGHTIVGTWQEPRSIGIFGSNAAQEAKLFMFLVQTQRRKQNFIFFSSFPAAASKFF